MTWSWLRPQTLTPLHILFRHPPKYLYCNRYFTYMNRKNIFFEFLNERNLISFPHTCLHSKDRIVYLQQTDLFISFFVCYTKINYYWLPVPVTVRLKVWFCGRSVMELWVRIPSWEWIFVCCVLSGRGFLRRDDHSSRGVLPNVLWQSLIVNHQYWECLGPLGLLRHGKSNVIHKFHEFTFMTRDSDTEIRVAWLVLERIIPKAWLNN